MMKDIKLTEEMLDRAVTNFGNPYRILKAFEKAARGEKITYVALGGSITQRYNATVPEKCFAARVADWWRQRFPSTEINYINAGIGATGSLIALHRLSRDVLKYEPDFVITEFAVNDGDSEYIVECYDNLLFNIMNSPTKPAVLCLGMVNSRGGSAQISHMRVARHYDVPFISYRDVAWGEIEAGHLSWEDFSNDNVHPNDAGHKLTAQLISYYLDAIFEKNSADFSDNNTSKPLISNRYRNARMYYIDDIVPDDNGCFEREKVNLNKIPYGWCARENGEPLVFKLEKCTAISILFERTNSGFGGKATVDANGIQTTLDADFKDGWGIYANYIQVFGSEKATDVLLKIIPCLVEDEHFSVAGIMVS